MLEKENPSVYVHKWTSEHKLARFVERLLDNLGD